MDVQSRAGHRRGREPSRSCPHRNSGRGARARCRWSGRTRDRRADPPDQCVGAGAPAAALATASVSQRAEPPRDAATVDADHIDGLFRLDRGARAPVLDRKDLHMSNRAAVARPTAERPARRARRRRGYALFALFAFPNLALIAVFAYWPIIANVYLSLTNWDFISPEPLFIGLTIYSSMLVSPSFHKVLWVSVVWVVVVVGVSLVLGVLLAALFSRKFPGTSAVTGIVFTPHVVSGAAIAVVWLFIFDPNYGLARVFFELFGAESPNWTTDADWA